MPSRRRTLVISDLRGGVNQVDVQAAVSGTPPIVMAASNVEFAPGTVARKREGRAPTPLDFGVTWISALYRHVPRYDWDAELWAAGYNDGASPCLVRLGPAASAVEIKTPDEDTIALAGLDTTNFCTFGQKLFVLMPTLSGVDRLHVWDGTHLRRAGLGAPTSPPRLLYTDLEGTVERRYVATYAVMDGTTLVARSDPSPYLEVPADAIATNILAQPITDPLDARVTHWELWSATADSDFADYRYVSSSPMGSITDYGDTGDEVLPEAGWNAPPPAAQFAVVDDGRLVMAGSRTNPALGSRVWFTPPLGSSDIGDDERVPVTSTVRNYIDVDPVGGSIVGLAPAPDCVYVFKAQAIYKLVKTGVLAAPYRQVRVASGLGAVSHKTIVTADDAYGAPAVYFLSRRGPYRISQEGVEYLGFDIETTWDTIDIGPSSSPLGFGVYYQNRHQVWWSLLTRDGTRTVLTYDTRVGMRAAAGVRGGWSIYPGAGGTCGTMFSTVLGVSPSSDLIPYMARERFDGSGYYDHTLDPTAPSSYRRLPYDSTFTTAPFAFGDFVQAFRITSVSLVCRPDPSYVSRLRVRVLKDYETAGVDYTFTVPASTKPRVVVRAHEAEAGAGPANCAVVQFQITDDAGVRPWQIDSLLVTYTGEEEA